MGTAASDRLRSSAVDVVRRPTTLYARASCRAGGPGGCDAHAMTGLELLHACAQNVLHDVGVTTSLQIALSEWAEDSLGIAAVVHELSVSPTRPSWEAVGYLNGGDCLAIHPPAFPDGIFSGISGDGDVVVMVAEAVQDLVQVLLWERGIDPAWPACPEHHGRHPLRAGCDVDVPVLRAEPSAVADSVARWGCPTGRTSIPIGQLGTPPPMAP